MKIIIIIILGQNIILWVKKIIYRNYKCFTFLTKYFTVQLVVIIVCIINHPVLIMEII